MIRGIHLVVPYYKQQHDYSCGPATLRMLFEYWNIHCSERGISRLAGTTKEKGTSPTGLVSAIRAVNLKYRRSAQAGLADIAAALRKRHPVLIHYREPEEESSHYALVVGMNDKHVIMHDAYHGKDFVLLRTEFKRRWLGYLNYPHSSCGWMIEAWCEPSS